MNHPVFGQLTKQYSIRKYDVYLSDSEIWVVMIKDYIIGFTWKGYNEYQDAKESIRVLIEYWNNPKASVRP